MSSEKLELEQSNTDFLRADNTPTNLALMKEIEQMVEILKSLKQKRDNLEAELKEADTSYQKYQVQVAQMFTTNGLSAVADLDGHIYGVETVSHCSITKAKRTNVARWLREQGMGSLVKHEYHCPESQLEKLQKAGVVYEDVEEMNTNQVKSWLLGALGQKGTPAVLDIDQLPDGLSLFQYDCVVEKN